MAITSLCSSLWSCVPPYFGLSAGIVSLLELVIRIHILTQAECNGYGPLPYSFNIREYKILACSSVFRRLLGSDDKSKSRGQGIIGTKLLNN